MSRAPVAAERLERVSEDDDYGGGHHHPTQSSHQGGGDSDEEDTKPIYRPSTERLKFNLRMKPKHNDLMVLKTVAGDQIRLLKKLKKRWKEVSVYTGVDEDGEVTKDVECKHGNHGVDSCYMEVMRRWLDGEGLQPTTWATFIEILEDMNLPELSKDVHRALHYRLDRS